MIFEGKESLKRFNEDACLKKVAKGREVFVLDNFSTEFHVIEEVLKSISESKFILMTTKEGSRGVDFKASSTAHVIIAFAPTSYAECVQALGRGCRDLTSSTDGTIICADVLTLRSTDYLKLLNVKDNELSKIMDLTCKIARMLHGFVADKPVSIAEAEELYKTNKVLPRSDPLLVMIFFGRLMQEGKNMVYSEGGEVLWTALRRIDPTGTMPETMHDNWEI